MKSSGIQQYLPLTAFDSTSSVRKVLHPDLNGRANKIDPRDRTFHDWYRFVLSYPPHLVSTYIESFGLTDKDVVLDPFCGTGTTVVESKLHGMHSVGLEANPFAHFAASVKVDWAIDPDVLRRQAQNIARSVLRYLESQGIDDHNPLNSHSNDVPLMTLDPESTKLLLANSISPLPLHKTLVLLTFLRQHQNERYYGHALLGLANALVYTISNLHFGPEVGVGKPKSDVPVVNTWLSEIDKICNDIRLILGKSFPEAKVHLSDARQISHIIEPRSIDAVITSPPYPNEKDYTRTTRLESVILGFIKTKTELRALKKNLIRSNTRGVYKGDDDDKWVAEHPEIQSIAEAIEKRRKELGKDSGFERLYGRVTKLYFGGMARHFADLRTVLRPGAQLAYVVGDQASYLRIMIRTGRIVSEIAQALGYELIRKDLFRTRYATATKEKLREEVVVLRWNG
jgi:hypothetical protein